MPITLLDILMAGGAIGLIAIIYPKFLFDFYNAGTGKKFDKKDSWKYRLGGLFIILGNIIIYIWYNYFRS